MSVANLDQPIISEPMNCSGLYVFHNTKNDLNEDTLNTLLQDNECNKSYS